LRRGSIHVFLQFLGTRSGKKIRIVGFHAARGRRTAVIGVNGDEQIGLRLVGEIRALIKRQVLVVTARKHNLGSKPGLQ
jgi:hypothetical protein